MGSVDFAIGRSGEKQWVITSTNTQKYPVDHHQCEKTGTGIIEGSAIALLVLKSLPYNIMADNTSLTNDRQEPENIPFLVQQLRTSEDNAILKQTAKLLGAIRAGNSDAINALIHLVCTTSDEPTRWVGIQSLAEIGTGNNDVIQTLIEQLSIVRVPTRRIIAQSLVKIAVGNRQAITTLGNLEKSTSDEITREAVAWTLGRIGKGESDAVQALIDAIYRSSDDYTRRISIDSLGRTEDRSPDTINALLHAVQTAKSHEIRIAALHILEKVVIGNTEAVHKLTVILESGKFDDHRSDYLIAMTLAKLDANTIIKLAEYSQNKHLRQVVAESLGYVDVGNAGAIKALINLLHKSQDEELLLIRAISSLEKIAVGNPDAIATLIEMLPNRQSWARAATIRGLSRIGGNRPDVLSALIDLACTSQDLEECRAVAEAFGEMTVSNSQVVGTLIYLMRTYDDFNLRYFATESLKVLDISNKYKVEAIVALLPTLKNTARYWDIVKVLGEIGVGNSQAMATLTNILQDCQDEDCHFLVSNLLKEMALN